MRTVTLTFALLGSILPIVYSQNACSPTPCGVNTNCQVNPSGAAVCRCNSGWKHLAGRNTIEGCPERITDTKSSFVSPPRSSFGTLHNRLGNNHVAVGGSRNRFRQSSQSSSFQGDPCSQGVCGTNADCRSQGSRAVCSCPPNYEGDPYVNCELDPCQRAQCGIGAECVRRGNQGICTCPPGLEGDPFVECRENPCASSQNPCHINADCNANGNRVTCTCRDGYEGDGYSCYLDPCLTNPCGINAECQRNGRNAQSHQCVCPRGFSGNPNFRCNPDPCSEEPCGPNAECTAEGNSARCTCRDGYVGNPTSPQGCRREPCSGNPCGQNAECESRGSSAVCRCPRSYVGDPYTRCTFDPCADAPCAPSAVCEVQGQGYECKCPPQYSGNAYVECRLDPCATAACGRNSECVASGTRAICKCLSGHSGSPNSRSGCVPDPCSIPDICPANARCENNNGRPLCTCENGFVGDGFQQCFRGDCISNDDCSPSQSCKDYRCVDPCGFSCGNGADCEPRNHVAICRCPKGFTGDPFQNCRVFTDAEICDQACGVNTDCTVGFDRRPVCKCKDNFIGNPLTGCRRECETDRECASTQKCQNYNCVAVCDQDACGENANCRPQNNRAQCTCPEDFLGEPYSRCYTECTRHDDCPSNTACIRFKCQDPCREAGSDPCGRGANCEVKNHKAVCSCPRGFTGDPFTSCREFTKQDLCNPNPCAPNAICQPGFDRNGGDRPVCTCPPGYLGDPLVRCNRGECERDSDCGSTQGCYNFKCEDPCRRGACGTGADCRVRNHAAVCTCPTRTVGDALVACRPTNANTRIVGQSRNRFRFKRYVDDILEYFL